MMLKFALSKASRESLTMSIVEVVAVPKGVRPFSEACCTLKGGPYLILWVLSAFRNTEEHV